MGRLISGPGFFRLALAMVVFVHHVSRLALGGAAVYLFFVLSGFWIAKMWRTEYVSTRSPYFTFVVSRVWRLWPVFFLTAGLGMLLWRLSGQAVSPPLAFSTVAIFGYSMQVVPNVPGWSLDIELQFYVLAPLLLWLGARSKPFLIAALGLTAFAWLSPVPGLPRYLPLFLLGVLYERDQRPISTGLALGGAALTLLGLLLVAASPWRGILLGGAHVTSLFAFNAALPSATPATEPTRCSARSRTRST
jgi:peptidoglycan/LPS O-acetylase OafA/YrhL